MRNEKQQMPKINIMLPRNEKEMKKAANAPPRCYRKKRPLSFFVSIEVRESSHTLLGSLPLPVLRART
jgi:hypothetical protein